MKERISIIYPIFGLFDTRKLFLVIESIKLQNYLDIEVIVSEQNEKPLYKEIAKKQKIVYVFNKINLKKDFYNIGFVRNRGIKKATGKYIYLNDSDIIFLSDSYLYDILALYKKRKSPYVSFPPMKRLLSNQLISFYKQVFKNGLFYELNNLKFYDGYTTNVDKKKKLKVLKYGYYKKTYTIFAKDFERINKSDLEEYGYGLLNFTYHAGAIFTEKKKVLNVGGYCEGFYGWGYDDVDLQIKLNDFFKDKEKFSRRSIPKKKKFNVLHLDHKNNFNKIKYNQNKAIFEKRRDISIQDLLKRDKLKNRF